MEVDVMLGLLGVSVLAGLISVCLHVRKSKCTQNGIDIEMQPATEQEKKEALSLFSKLTSLIRK